MRFVVYIILRAKNGVCIYVGKGLPHRPLQHIPLATSGVHKNKRLARTITRDISEGFGEPTILIIQSGLTEATALNVEALLIKRLGRADRGLGPLMNLTDGGEGLTGHSFSQDHRNKISSALTGREVSAAARNKMSLAKIGRALSDEHRIKLSASHMGNKSHTGRTFTEEHTKRMSEASRGKPKSQQHRDNISKGRKGLRHSMETRAKISMAAKLRHQTSTKEN